MKVHKKPLTWTDFLDRQPKRKKLDIRCLRDIGLDSMDWIDLAQNRDKWRALVNTVMNLRIP
jgi:hypothetical protein